MSDEFWMARFRQQNLWIINWTANYVFCAITLKNSIPVPLLNSVETGSNIHFWVMNLLPILQQVQRLFVLAAVLMLSNSSWLTAGWVRTLSLFFILICLVLSLVSGICWLILIWFVYKIDLLLCCENICFVLP